MAGRKVRTERESEVAWKLPNARYARVPMPRVRRPLAVIAALALAAGVAGCGGTNTKEPAAGTTSAATVTLPASVAAPAQAYPATATKNTTV